jgi:cytochrome P450
VVRHPVRGRGRRAARPGHVLLAQDHQPGQASPDLLSAFPDGPPDRVLVSLDPPDHTRLRGLARNAFTPKLVEAREAEVRTLCHALIDRFAADGRGDLVAQFAAHLPVQVITRLVGAPVEHTDDFRQWAHDRIALLGSAPSLGEDERAA